MPHLVLPLLLWLFVPAAAFAAIDGNALGARYDALNWTWTTSNWAEGTNQVAVPGRETRIGGEGVTYDLGARAVLLLVAK